MTKRIKMLALPVLAVIISVLFLSSCTNVSRTEDASQLDPRQILSDSIQAFANVSSYNFSLDMNIDMEATGGSNPGQATATLQSNGTADTAAKNLKMDLDMSVKENMATAQDESTPTEVSATMYMMGDTLYINTEVPGNGSQWMKTTLDEATKQNYDLDLVQQQLAPLENATQIEYLRTETVDGSECWVLKVVPNLDAMKQWLNEQQLGAGSLDLSQVQKLEDVFKKLAYNTWIAKDTKLIKKINIQMSLVLNAQQFAVAESEFENLSMDAEINMSMKDYNKPVNITLPDEAQNATEM